MQRMLSGRAGRRLAALVLAAGLAACSRAEDPTPPAGTITATLSRARVPLGSPIEVTYRITLTPDAPSLPNHLVFVHFLDADDEMMWTDDHEPPIPTAEWRPGETVEYTRTMFVPVYPYVGPTKVVAGLYTASNNQRVRLSGQDLGDRSYLVGQFELQPQTENVFLMFKDGWHGAEMAPENQDIEWQWTKKEATLAFRNPKRDATLFLQVDNPAAKSGGAREMAVKLGQQALAVIPVSDTQSPVHKVPLPAAQLGEDEMIELQFVSDRTFVPALEPGSASGDTRELGVRVFHAFVQTSETR